MQRVSALPRIIAWVVAAAAVMAVPACSFDTSAQLDGEVGSRPGPGPGEPIPPPAPEPECGNASLAPEEACDDGNRVTGDGCSAECAIEPGFVCGPEGCRRAARAAVIAPFTLIGAALESTPDLEVRDCAEGEVVVGMELREDAQYGGIGAVRALCADPTFDDSGAIAWQLGSTTGRLGPNGPELPIALCPTNRLLVGLEVRIYDFVRAVALQCAPAAVVDGAVEIGESSTGALIGDGAFLDEEDVEITEVDCGPGRAAGGRLAADTTMDGLDGLAIRCGDLVVR